MTKARPEGSTGLRAWDAFAGRHAGSPFLAHDPLYALTEPLIDAVAKHVPGFFDRDAERFERDLARTASLGFFLHRPLGATAEPSDQVGGRTLDQRQETTSREIDRLLAEELDRAGADRQDVSTYFERGTNHRWQIESRKDAYAGWLVTNPQYRDEVRQLRERWEYAVQAAGRFPRLPMTWVPDPTDEISTPPDFRGECYHFFRRWCLETLATWDLPVPMEPDLGTGLRRDVDVQTSGGLVLFVPWYLLRGGKLNWREVIQQSRLAAAPDHLLDWVNKRVVRGGTDLGDVRYTTLRWLYRYDALVLARRYARACEGHRQRLDRALAEVIGREEDTVKKVRRELSRSLGRGQ